MRLLKLLSLVMALMLIGAVPALAHVTVIGEGAVAGGSDAIITFRVPTESDTASTDKLEVALPTDTPLASVDMLAMPGWTESQTSVTLATPIKTDDGNILSAVSRVIWTAQPGYEIKPGSFGEFTLIVGQLPDVKSLTFKALETYSDKKVVSWIQVPAPGQTADSVDYPAPVLSLDATPAATDTGGPSVSASPVSAAPTQNTGVATVLAIVALVLAILACGVAGAGWLRRRGPAGQGTAQSSKPLVSSGSRD